MNEPRALPEISLNVAPEATDSMAATFAFKE